jgi:hypothetical protein
MTDITQPALAIHSIENSFVHTGGDGIYRVRRRGQYEAFVSNAYQERLRGGYGLCRTVEVFLATVEVFLARELATPPPTH